MASLDELRRRIDGLDEQIVRALNERAQVAVEIGRLKAASGAGVFAADREREVLDRVAALSTGPMPGAALAAIYREMMSASLALERPPRVGYLGPAGSFSHEASVAKFGSSVEYEPLLSIDGIFDAMERGHVDYGIVPVDNNSTGGVVLETLDAFLRCDVRICNELRRAIHQNLIARCPLGEIETVYSKPEAFKQCQRWLVESGLADKVSPAPSTSRAVEMAATEPKAAAIGSALAAAIYDVPIVTANIEDNPRNATRFFVLGRESAGPTGNDRTSLLLVTAHESGALVKVLLVFQRRGVNMTMITSRPSPRTASQYYFFVDLDGHAEDGSVQSAIEEATAHCHTLRVLGSYPRAVEIEAA